ncbi:hypothetical protein GA0111570_103232 [Raineyella antarctica]|uniref:Uncharacterized protein n=1 Tax=Raineyella antarctica TaxID=1577474 RepID=A0A1G6GH31_9ACTN|nr:hypothetical protein [Raineyella antarctica]SDB81199.1 hypothetical protein GA0111570_103232 [Raineyella antarctica]
MSQLAHPTHASRSHRPGTISIAMGVLALIGSAWSIYLTLGSAGPELSNVVRGIGMALLPIGLVVGVPTGVMAFRRGGADRAVGLAGLALAALALGAFVVLLATTDY